MLELKESQKFFMWPNAFSIAEMRFSQKGKQVGIYSENKPVGFAWYGNNWISRYMISKEHQGRGFGKLGFRLILNEMQHTTDRVEIQVVTSNISAINFFEKFGFVKSDIGTGEEVDMFLEF